VRRRTVSAVVYTLPAVGNRLEGMAAAPADALGLVRLAIQRADSLAELIRQAAPAPELTAAAGALAALRGPLASLEVTAGVLLTARAAGEASASRPRLRTLPADGAR
jgi:hypothetical protein